MVHFAKQDKFSQVSESRLGRHELLVIHQHLATTNNRIAIFVHGLNGKRYATWGSLPLFLFEDYTDFDIGLFDYASGLRRLCRRDSMTLVTHIQQLADTIRDLSYSQVVLVGHSMGGLLCKGAIKDLIDSQTRTLQGSRAVDRIVGLFLVATPQAGSLNVPRLLSRASVDAQVLRAHSPFVTEINRRFADRVDTSGAARPIPESAASIATYAIVAGGDVWVDELSAGLSIGRDRVKNVRGSHTSIVKLTSKEDDVYQWLAKRPVACLGKASRRTVDTTNSQILNARLPQQLPSAADDFRLFGRDDVLERGRVILTGLTGQRLVHIRGEAGIGKTTTAVRLARSLSDEFPSGSIYIDLRGEEGQAVRVPKRITWTLHEVCVFCGESIV